MPTAAISSSIEVLLNPFAKTAASAASIICSRVGVSFLDFAPAMSSILRGGGDSFFRIHNWWHKALFHLAIDQHEETVVIYDREVRRDQNATAMDLVDASALLWRLHLNWQDMGGRRSEVAAGWDAYADGKLYPFNDWR